MDASAGQPITLQAHRAAPTEKSMRMSIPTPAAMPRARLSLTGTIAALITSLASALDDDPGTLDLDGVEVLTGLLAAYTALIAAQSQRKADR